jgi:hypothetical protein
MRSPAASIMALIAPVRFRSVASGFKIENVRSSAIGQILVAGEVNVARLIAASLPTGNKKRSLRPISGVLRITR